MGVYDHINRNPTRGEIVKTGLVVLGGMALLGALFEWKQHNHGAAMGLWIAGGAFFALTLLPVIGRLAYILWMGLGITIGLVTSPIIMGILYLVLIVPVGLFFRLTGRDLMRRKIDPQAASYWEDYPRTEDPSHYLRQF